MFGPMNFGIDENRAKEIAKKSLEMVGLDQTYLEKSPFDLSGGQKRRVAIAGILAVSYTHLDVYKRQLHYSCVYLKEDLQTILVKNMLS